MSAPESMQTNVPEFSVSELAFSLKRTLEETYGRVRVRGELSRVSIAGSGHMYSSIKDDQAVIDAVCWRGTLSKISVKPEEGLEVICTGRISTYPQRSNYQLIIESMELAGEGALLKMLEERRKKLAAEGLFAEERKKPIPFLPQTIGVITSPTGAVIRDIIHRLSDRFPSHVLLWPVTVQGENAAEQIADAIDGFQYIHERGIKRPDVLIVARGGGSLEDLMPFNEEIVVRAAANSEIPIISAVGHETDTTLIDYASDLRAPTPTGAAEKSVPIRAELMALTLDYEKRLMNAATRQLQELSNRLSSLARAMGDPTKLLDIKAQRLDHVSDKIGRVYKQYLSSRSTQLLETSSKLTHPRALIHQAELRLERWGEALAAQAPKLTADLDKRLHHAAKMLEAFSFENVLKRGFVVVRDEAGKLVPDAGLVSDGQMLELQFREGKRLGVRAGNAPVAPIKKPAKKPSPKKEDPDQQSLF